MPKKNLANSEIPWKNIHFIGIGGSGMSGLARILKAEGKKISGSNDQASVTTAALEAEGMKIFIGHNARNLARDTEAVIFSAAVPSSNLERREARKKNLPELTYAEAVGLLTRERKTICICGTHGKTTTTAMVTAAFLKAKKDPTVIVGSTIRELEGRNARNGKSNIFILESCEYRRAFLNFQPEVIVLTNIEADHLDYYRDLRDYRKAFQEFIEKLPQKPGLLIANSDDKNIRQIVKNIEKKISKQSQHNRAKIIWYGRTAGSDYQLKGKKLFYHGQKLTELELKIPGDHNLMNATAALALAHELKISLVTSRRAIENYRGSARRFELKGHIGKAVVIDDYAHHPTEIKATLAAARQKFGTKAKILCIFQPHQYSRTLKLLDGFARSFADADEVIIPNIYEVRDTAQDIQAINAETLVEKIRRHHPQVRYGHGFAKTLDFIRKNSAQYDVIMTLGAGNIETLAKNLTSIKNKLK